MPSGRVEVDRGGVVGGLGQVGRNNADQQKAFRNGVVSVAVLVWEP